MGRGFRAVIAHAIRGTRAPPLSLRKHTMIITKEIQEYIVGDYSLHNNIDRPLNETAYYSINGISLVIRPLSL